ncbi:MAG: hypothetical protein ACRDWE_00470, partial [Acidimicrobiales bacterium]
WAGTTVAGNPLNGLWQPGAYGAHATTLERLGGYLGRRGPLPSYVGPVELGAAGASLLLAWRRAGVWLLAIVGTFAAWCSLGALVSLSPGHVSDAWTPWRVLGAWPLVRDVIPQRFTAVVDLCVALVIGLGIDRAYRLAVRERRGVVRRRLVGWFAATALGIGGVAIAASPWGTYEVPFATRAVTVPRWYATRAPALPGGTVVLSVPFPFPGDGESAPMVWQAVDGMGFRLAGAYAKVPGRSGRPIGTHDAPLADEVLASFDETPGRLPASSARRLAAIRTALGTWGVQVVVVSPDVAHERRAVSVLRAAIGRAPHRELGAWVWRLDPG